MSRAWEFLRTQPFSFTVPDYRTVCNHTEMNSEKASPSADICRGGAAIVSSSVFRGGVASSSVVWPRCWVSVESTAESLGLPRYSGGAARLIMASSGTQLFPGSEAGR